MTPAPDIFRTNHKNLQNKYIRTPKIIWDNKNHKVKKNVEIRFLTADRIGYKFITEDNKEPEFGYLKPLMIVIINNKNKKWLYQKK